FGMVFRQETFTLFLDLVVTLFCLTLIAVRYQSGKWIQYGIVDVGYLLQLSADAILPLTQSLENGKLEESVNQKVAALLICFENRQSFQRPLAWQEFNLGHYYAEKAIQSVKSLLTNYRTITEEGTVWVMLPSGDRFSCNP
ncbi:MAG: hypothetical protein ACPL0B_03100, partial [Anaerolineales bacterium]